jgi:hypothetical protein
MARGKLGALTSVLCSTVQERHAEVWQTMTTLDNVTVITSLVNSSVTTIAVVAGGFWAYFKFAKGRTFSMRADLDISGWWRLIEGRNILKTTIVLKNLGSSKIAYKPGSANYQISKPVPYKEGSQPGPIAWEKIGQQHALFIWKESDRWVPQWIEPGETLTDDILIDLDVSAPLPILLDVEITLLHGHFRGSEEFATRSIILEDPVVRNTLSVSGRED